MTAKLQFTCDKCHKVHHEYELSPRFNGDKAFEALRLAGWSVVMTPNLNNYIITCFRCVDLERMD